jgi:hypothetical protein
MEGAERFSIIKVTTSSGMRALSKELSIKEPGVILAFGATVYRRIEARGPKCACNRF